MYSIANNIFDFQYVIYLLLPLLFSITSIYLSIYFIISKKKEDQSANHINLVFIIRRSLLS